MATIQIQYTQDDSEKQDQINLLDALQTQLPDGYLRDIIQDAAGVIRQAIRNDFGSADIHGLHGQVIEARKELADTQKEIAAAKNALQQIEERHKRTKRDIDSLKDDAQQAFEACRTALRKLADFQR